MPRTKTYLEPKPGKSKLLIKSRQNPGSVNEALVGMRGGEERTGFLGSGNLSRKPDYVSPSENLDGDEKERKRLLQNLLTKTIEPNSLSSKSTHEMDRRSLARKLNKRSLDELWVFLPEKVKRLSNEKLKSIVEGVDSLSEEDKADIQTLYMEVSP